MKHLSLILLSAFLALSAQSQQYTIKAALTGFPDGTPFYLKDLDVDAVIDSAFISRNTFKMTGRFDDPPQSLWLYCNYKNSFYYVVLLIGNDKISVKGDLKDFPYDLAVTGSRSQDDVNALRGLTKEGYRQRDRLVTEYFALKGDSAEIKGKAIWKTIHGLDSMNETIRKKFVLDHPGSFLTLQELYFLRRVFGRDSLQHLYASLSPSLQQNKMGTRISNYLKVGDPIKTGEAMEDFEAFDRDGKSHRPSDYKGKYILLDFSATYCGPCIQSLEDMKKLSATYPDKLAIITLSGDAGKKTWLEGLDRDHPDWLSLWDGKGIYSQAMLKYGVSGFPTFCLVGPDGKIVSLWSGYGKEKDGAGSLETAVTKQFNK